LEKRTKELEAEEQSSFEFARATPALDVFQRHTSVLLESNFNGFKTVAEARLRKELRMKEIWEEATLPGSNSLPTMTFPEAIEVSAMGGSSRNSNKYLD
jgi:hypothetical protein